MQKQLKKSHFSDQNEKLCDKNDKTGTRNMKNNKNAAPKITMKITMMYK